MHVILGPGRTRIGRSGLSKSPPTASKVDNFEASRSSPQPLSQPGRNPKITAKVQKGCAIFGPGHPKPAAIDSARPEWRLQPSSGERLLVFIVNS